MAASEADHVVTCDDCESERFAVETQSDGTIGLTCAECGADKWGQPGGEAA